MYLKLYDPLRSLICPFSKIAKYIPNDGKLLDIGSGYGTFCFFLLKERPRVKITGLELDRKRVDYANKRATYGTNLGFICDNIIRFITDERFDTITCLDLLHHIPRRYQPLVFRRINELLEDNGLLIVKDMNDKPFYKYVWNYMHDWVMTRSGKLYYVPKGRMVRLLEHNGFTVEGSYDIPNFLYAHYIVVCRKRAE